MKLYLRPLALLCAITLLSFATATTAQEKKKDDTKKPADTKKAEEPKKKAEEPKPEVNKAGEIQIYKNDNGKWRYRIVNGDGKTVVMPVPQATWETKAEVEKAIADLKTMLTTLKPTEVK